MSDWPHTKKSVLGFASDCDYESDSYSLTTVIIPVQCGIGHIKLRKHKRKMSLARLPSVS